MIFRIAYILALFSLALSLSLSGQEARDAAVAAVGEVIQPGKPVDLDGKAATLTKLDSLPFVESDYTKRFKFDSFGNPKLKELRGRYKLDEAVAPGKDEFDRQVHLMDWTHRQFKKFGRPSKQAAGALEILQAVDDGHSFFCTQYGQVFVSAAASLGWVDRSLALRRHQGVNKNGGSTEHTATEIWSNQFGKWIMLDPTSNLYLEKDDVPLNAWEIRQEWFYREGKDLVFVIGKERKRYRKADLPVFLARFEGFGDLTFDPDELDKYGFIGYIPNTDLMDAGFDYGKMFIVKDGLCDGTSWHTRDLPAHPATDPYFPIGQAALSVVADGDGVQVNLKTLTPNFLRFEVRMDGGEWKPCGDRLKWNLHDGLNRLQARTVNQWDVAGPISTAEIEVQDDQAANTGGGRGAVRPADEQLRYHFDASGISRNVLENYLERAVTMAFYLVPEKPEGRRVYPFLNSFPLRIKEVSEKPLEGVLEVNHLDSIYGKSQGGVTPSGWPCESLPYLVEFDNFGRNRKPNVADPGSIFAWGWDEISWLAQQDEDARNAWLKYARDWISETDPNGHLQMPGCRMLSCPNESSGSYRANTRSAACPIGYSQEETIRKLWLE